MISELIERKKKFLAKNDHQKSLETNNWTEITIKNTKKVENRVFETRRIMPHHLILKSMNLITLHQKSIEITPVSKDSHDYSTSMLKFSRTYIEFIKSIDLSDSKQSIKIFKIKVFEKIFSSNYIDKNIRNFIEKIIHDPIFYEKYERNIYYEILKFIYFYSLKLKLNLIMVQVRDKLIKFNHMNSNILSEFNFFITGDLFIDKFSIKSKIKTSLFNEVKFLNSAYTSHLIKSQKDDEFLDLFFKRFLENITKIDEIYTLSFLKDAFTSNTLIHSFINKYQIIRIPFELFTSIKTPKEVHFDSLYRLSDVLIDKFSSDFEAYSVILNEMSKISCPFKKQRKNMIKYLIKQMTGISSFIDILEETKESFNDLQVILTEYFSLIKCLEEEKIEITFIIEILLQTFKMINLIKNEFIPKFSTSFVSSFKIMFDKIHTHLKYFFDETKRNDKQDKYLEKEKNGIKLLLDNTSIICENLSKFILNTQKNEMTGQNSSKKKKKGSLENIKTKSESLIEKLVFSVRKVEIILQENKNSLFKEYSNISLLKDRSIVIK